MTGVVAGFETKAALCAALDHLAAKDLGDVETYTPTALDEHPTGSPLPLMMFVAGMFGCLAFFLLMTNADVWAFPLNIGGRPKLAWPSFVPIAFELGILCAMGIGFFGYFVICRMPRLYEQIDECDSFRRASGDRWFVAFRSDDPQQVARARAAFAALRPASLEEFTS